MSTRRRVVNAAGVVVVGLGALAWGLAATSMAAVQAAEARALGPGHTPEMPGDDELALVAHDARLAALVVVACGLAIVVAGRPRRTASWAWGSGVLAAVVANATLGRAVDGGSVLGAAAGVALVVGAAGAVVGALPTRRGTPAGDVDRRRHLTPAGLLAAGTLPVLVLQGMGSERYREWIPADLAAADLVTALALALVVLVVGVDLARGAAGVVLGVVLPSAALTVLLERAGSSWLVRDEPGVMGVVLVLAWAPLLLPAVAGDRTRVAGAVAGLLASGALLAVVPALLVLPVIAGGVMSLVVTGPAGASISYDGLPVVGGGVLVAAVLLGVHLVLGTSAPPTSAAGRETAPTRAHAC